MHYTLDWLIEQDAKGASLKYLPFWGHTPSKDGSVSKTCFSQWWAGHPFEVKGIRYATAEHWMMAGKARLFGDEEMLRQILENDSAPVAKKLGRKVRNFVPKTWEAHHFDLVREGNIHKFSQHADLKEFLLNTGDRIIVEASPYDKIWGIGMSVNHADIERPAKWKGRNLLGFALMEVRDQLRG